MAKDTIIQNEIIFISELVCPKTFGKIETSRYEFCYKSGRVAYEEAKQNCIAHGLKLVQIESEDKAIALDSIASNSYDYAWLGLICPTESNDCNSNFDLWVWEPSNSPLMNTTGWETRFLKTGNTIYGGGVGEYCAHWWHSRNGLGTWAPQGCSDRIYGTLCEKGTAFLS